MDRHALIPPPPALAVAWPAAEPDSRFARTTLVGPPRAPKREPVVLPLVPRTGWARAGQTHRLLAVAAAPVALTQVVLALAAAPDQGTGTGRSSAAMSGLLLVSYLLAPALFYAAARVVRPHVNPGGERAWRHIAASAGTAMAVPVVTMLAAVPSGSTDGPDDRLLIALLLGVPAFLIGLVTVVWGVAVMVGRAAGQARRHVHGSSRTPGSRPSRRTAGSAGRPAAGWSWRR